jgi:predicted nuclease of predicted toxin-antitoxin system
VIWEAAQASGRFLITQDMDFADTRRFAPGGHHGVLLVRFRNPGRNAILRRLSALFQAEDIGSWSGCFVVATEQKLRVRRQKLPP